MTFNPIKPDKHLIRYMKLEELRERMAKMTHKFFPIVSDNSTDFSKTERFLEALEIFIKRYEAENSTNEN